MTPKDWHGAEIKSGDVLAVAMTVGRHAQLVQRFVRCVHADHLEVQPNPEEPSDKRQIGRITNFNNCIIVS